MRAEPARSPSLRTAAWFDDVWSVPVHITVDSGQGALAEWSLDAIGWLGGFLADLAAREGAAVPLLFTASRSASAD